MELLDKVEKGESLKTPLINSVIADIDKQESKANFQSSKNVPQKENKSTLYSSERTSNKQKSGLTFFELFRVLLPYFWPAKGTDGAFINRIRSSSTWLMVALSKTCNLSAPLFLSAATNYIVAKDYYSAAKSMIIFSALKFSASVFKELQSIIYIKVKQQASIQLQELTFTHLHSLSLNWHLSKKSGSVMKSMDRGVEAANQLISSLFLFLLPAILECLAVVVFFFILYRQSLLGGVVLIGVSLYTVATVGITQWRKKFREQTNKHDNDFHDKAMDSIINYETVKYFTGEEFEISRFKNSVVQYQRYNSSTQLSLGLLNVTQQFILTATALGTMLLAGQAVVNGSMTLGGWIAVQSWVTTIFIPLNFLGTVYASIFQSFIDIRNLSELLSESPDIVDQPGAISLPFSQQHNPATTSQGVSVEFKDVSFHYPEQPAEKGLKHVNISVAAGTTTAIVGHTGAGKTTISRLLFRFYDPVGGAVLLNGFNIKYYTQQSVRQSIGIVPQDTVLFNDTILHNIKYGRLDATFEEVENAARAAQIIKFVDSLPEKWNTVVGERGLKLSGGEKQRVAIARCLLKNPPIVLLDEATSALDTITENSIQEALAALGKNRTVLVIAHRLSTVRHADQIVVLEGGNVVESGSHEELLGNPRSVYRQMWQVQSHSGGGMAAVKDGEDEGLSSFENSEVGIPIHHPAHS